MSKIRISIEYDISTQMLDVKAPTNQTPHVVWLLEVVKAALLRPTQMVQPASIMPVPPGGKRQ